MKNLAHLVDLADLTDLADLEDLAVLAVLADKCPTMPFSWWTRSYFELLILFKKNCLIICDPYKIFNKYLA